MENDKFYFWLKVSSTIFIIVLLLTGFGLGYLYNNYKNQVCREKPFNYAIKEMNKLNNEKFYCSCSSYSGFKHFSFDEEGLIPS